MKISNVFVTAFFLSVLLAFGTSEQANAQTDTLGVTPSEMTQEDINLVMSVFDGQQPSDIISRADAFISTGKTPEERARLAYYIYRYYRESKIMGYDEIAVYVADAYFIKSGYTLPDTDAGMEMKLLAQTNWLSLIGMR